MKSIWVSMSKKTVVILAMETYFLPSRPFVYSPCRGPPKSESASGILRRIRCRSWQARSNFESSQNRGVAYYCNNFSLVINHLHSQTYTDIGGNQPVGEHTY